MAQRHFLVRGILRGLATGLAGVLALGLLAGPVCGQSCPADPAWLKPDAPEADFTQTRDTNCQIHQWAVQEFLYQVQTVDGLARFLGLASPHALFLYPGDKPAPYPGSQTTLFKLGANMARLRATGKANAASPLVFLPRTLKTPDTTFDAATQAGSNAVLIDQQGQWVYYTASINKVYYDYVVNKGIYTLTAFLSAPPSVTFPVGAVETKSSWRIAAKGGTTYIPNASKSFYTIEAQVCNDATCKTLVPATMALVGLHVVGLIQGHPEMIWATFEHNLNAPDCQNTPSTDTRSSFYKAGQKCGTAPFWETCNKVIDPTDKTTPSEVCRAHPQGEPEGSQGNTANILSLNQSFHKLLPAGSVWANYDYASAVWTTGKVGPNGLIVLDDSEIRGSKKAANTSLESFTQEQNCLHCHTYQPLQIGTCFGKRDDPNAWKNLYVSHLFGLLCKTTK
jgi:hypothetical protein